MVSYVQEPHTGKTNIQDFCSLKYILYLLHGEGWPRAVTLLLMSNLVLLSRLKANVTKFSHCANGVAQQGWFVPTDIKCWSSHFCPFSVEVLAHSCGHVLTSRVCLFYFCHHLSILPIASVLNAVQHEKNLGSSFMLWLNILLSQGVGSPQLFPIQVSVAIP